MEEPKTEIYNYARIKPRKQVHQRACDVFDLEDLNRLLGLLALPLDDAPISAPGSGIIGLSPFTAIADLQAA